MGSDVKTVWMRSQHLVRVVSGQRMFPGKYVSLPDCNLHLSVTMHMPGCGFTVHLRTVRRGGVIGAQNKWAVGVMISKSGVRDRVFWIDLECFLNRLHAFSGPKVLMKQPISP